MVCSKCAKKLKQTELATPGVKRKAEMYYGSPSTTLGGAGASSAGSSSSSRGSSSSSSTAGKSTLGSTGIGKSKLLTSKAKNPYAAYASSCDSCKTKTEQGRKFCQRCAYQRNACPMCGKGLTSSASKNQPVVQGQKFNLK
ncbi:hypothetical protein BO70DRAFT_365958 [Aspergillus heteromorphus CBS 117.55]|uniref:Cysteine-rich PDZ-binding protein n=1 Tax=Aspergillus heteromorphus CBS 117.55 TaxID=1448321 RepID=A0A317V4D4_9EURO|nr:uncharacterized protein BO70DRAFT_365958 [Aspergillus heteromorphus CBS 117.55]PWY69143.1 hypothetical protein BO70DRAFT_365958 [Aspergillus heteromorphus CBS 117.55]